jgi:hypothetical protein
MITLNGNKFAANDKEFTSSLFSKGGTCVGFYRTFKNTINILDMQKVKVGIINKHKVLALATKRDDGKWWYSYGDIPLVGVYGSTRARTIDIDKALEELACD